MAIPDAQKVALSALEEAEAAIARLSYRVVTLSRIITGLIAIIAVGVVIILGGFVAIAGINNRTNEVKRNQALIIANGDRAECRDAYSNEDDRLRSALLAATYGTDPASIAQQQALAAQLTMIQSALLRLPSICGTVDHPRRLNEPLPGIPAESQP